MKIRKYVYLNLKRRVIQTLVLVTSLTLSLLFGLILTKYLLITHERYKTLAREGQAIITSKSNEIDSLLFALNLEGEKNEFIPFNLYQTLLTQNQKSFEDGQKVYTQINQVIPFLQFGLFEKKYNVLGTNSEFLNRYNSSDSIKFISGRWVDNENEIVIGNALANKLNLHLDTFINIQINKSIQTKQFKIVGIIDGHKLAWDFGLYTSISSAQHALTEAGLLKNSIWHSDVLSHVLVYINPDQYPTLLSLINDRTVSQIISIPETIKRLEEITMSGTNITSILVLLVILLGICAISGVILTRAENTINSLAILNSLGYGRFDLFKIVVIENIIIWSISSLLALIFYLLFFNWIQNNISFFSSSNITFWSPEFYLIFLALGLSIILLSFIPVSLLMKKGIHNILRTQ